MWFDSQWNPYSYRILPIKGASPNNGAAHSLGEAKSIINVQNTHSLVVLWKVPTEGF